MLVNSFPKTARLLCSAQFSYVFSCKNKLVTPCFVLWIAPNQLDHARLGLCVSKKTVKTGVNRNRCKRLIKESFRCHKDKLIGYDVIVVARKGICHSPSKAVFSQLEKLWSKVGKREELQK